MVLGRCASASTDRSPVRTALGGSSAPSVLRIQRSPPTASEMGDLEARVAEQQEEAARCHERGEQPPPSIVMAVGGPPGQENTTLEQDGQGDYLDPQFVVDYEPM